MLRKVWYFEDTSYDYFGGASKTRIHKFDSLIEAFEEWKRKQGYVYNYEDSFYNVDDSLHYYFEYVPEKNSHNFFTKYDERIITWKRVNWDGTIEKFAASEKEVKANLYDLRQNGYEPDFANHTLNDITSTMDDIVEVIKTYDEGK